LNLNYNQETRPVKITIKIYGTLKLPSTADPVPSPGEMEVPEGFRVADLLTRLGITAAQGVTVMMNGRLTPQEAELVDSALVQIFQVMPGG
jgi:sulfur carrier protein ThiS